MTDDLDVAAERILREPPARQRVLLAAVLDRARKATPDSLEERRLLTFNSHLTTRIREIAEQRRVPHPWNP